MGAMQTTRSPGARGLGSSLSDNKLCRPNPEAITNVNSFLEQALRCEVLAERSPGQIYARNFLAPEFVMLRWVDIDCLMDPTMHGEV